MPWLTLQSVRQADSCCALVPSVFPYAAEGLIPNIRAQQTAEGSSDRTTPALGAIQQHHHTQSSIITHLQRAERPGACPLCSGCCDTRSRVFWWCRTVCSATLETVLRGVLSIDNLYCKLILRVVDDPCSAAHAFLRLLFTDLKLPARP